MNNIMKKKVIVRINSIILVIMFALCMAGCGKEDIQQNSDKLIIFGIDETILCS